MVDRSNFEDRYIILKMSDGSYAIAKKLEGSMYEFCVPNAGTTLRQVDVIRNAFLDQIVRSVENREEREREFQKSLTLPHPFILADRNTNLCYCGLEIENAMHIAETG